MGGRALKKVKAQRMGKELYTNISNNILSKLREDSINCAIPYEIPGKDSFGDIDVLICSEINLKEWIITNFNPIEIHVNGTVISFAYEVDSLHYQIDFIKVKYLDAAMIFFSYGDTGSIVGRYSGYHGVMFSENGLSVKVRGDLLDLQDAEYVYDVVHLTSEPREILEYIGLSYDTWVNGFSDIQSLYDWLTSSRLFDREVFLFLKMDKRKRLGLRPFFIEFLRSINVNLDSISDIILKKTNFERKEEQIDALNHFNKIDQLSIIRERVLRNEERKNKFKSQIFSDLGIEKLQLCETMKSFKQYIGSEIFEDWLDTKTKDEVNDCIKNWILLIKNMEQT